MALRIINRKQESLPSLDGLRGLSALLVVICHGYFAGWYPLPGNMVRTGTLGVMLFFTLSGFLMAYYYLEGRTLSYWLAFAIRRIFRIYPLFFCVTSAMWLTGNMSASNVQKHWLLLRGDGIFWTILVECQFYLIFPFLVMTANAILIPKWKLCIWGLIWAGVMLATRLGMFSETPMHHVWHHLSFFIGGITMAICYTEGYTARIPRNAWNLLVIVIIITFGLFLYKPYFNVMDNLPSRGWPGTWLNAMLLSGLVLSVARSSGPINYIFSNPFSRFTGMVSYSIYLTHAFILALPYPFSREPKHFILVLLLVLTSAFITFKLIEEPYIKAGKYFSNLLRKQI